MILLLKVNNDDSHPPTHVDYYWYLRILALWVSCTDVKNSTKNVTCL